MDRQSSEVSHVSHSKVFSHLNSFTCLCLLSFEIFFPLLTYWTYWFLTYYFCVLVFSHALSLSMDNETATFATH